MNHTRLFFAVVGVVLLTAFDAVAQSTVNHRVKKNETLYGIARDYGITVDQLKKANPGMESAGYQLKTDDVIQVPTAKSNVGKAPAKDAIRLGIMLPLHNVNNDGRRMVEYYRGVLLACDSLKKEGISVDVRAWNVLEDCNIQNVLKDPNVANRDIIIGPLYSKQMSALSDFVERHDIRLVIPFSITAPELYSNRNIFQIYQPPTDLTELTARRAVEWFKDYHPIIVDCADSTSTKGSFTASYRRLLEVADIRYSLTSLKSSEADFAKAFVLGRPNVVVLNTARSRDMITVMSRLKGIMAANPTVSISMFGYTEWLMYLEKQKDNFHKYNVYIPAPFYTNLESAATMRLEQKYRNSFHQDMMQALPRFAFTGYDHAVFFLRGLHKYGKTFDGAAGRFGYQPVQTPLKFERMGNGGLQNRSYMFIHYKPDGTVESINY